MHILMTADTVGGVWTYTRELATGLVRRGHQVTLVSFGKIPTSHQVSWMSGLRTLQYFPTAFRLEWMQDAERDIAASGEFLSQLVAEIKPDVLHFSQYAYGSLAGDIPRIVVAHSDVVSWWVAVHGEEPPSTPWVNWYRKTVAEGLKGATVVVAPSQAMRADIARHYLRPEASVVIYNGRDPSLFNPRGEKEDCVLSIGRLWDQAKQVSLLAEREHPIPICIVGSQENPDQSAGGQAIAGKENPAVKVIGPRAEAEVSQLYATAAIYAATSRYEPFGLAPVEAALSGCAIVANDIPVFRELWGDSVYFFRQNDANSLAAAIRELSSHPDLCREYAERAYKTALQRFSVERMITEYERLYSNLTAQEAAA